MRTAELIILVLISLGLAAAHVQAGEAGRAPVTDLERFEAFLASIDDGKGPGPKPEAPPRTGPGVQEVTVQAWNCLDIVHDLQRKDTGMLCLEGCPENGTYAWDAIQPDHSGHGSHYCARASIKMINSYYGGSLSQDRITYYMLIQYPDSNKKDFPPEYQLWHKKGSGSEFLPWALGRAYNDWSNIQYVGGKPSYANIKTWINAGRPIQTFIPGHSMVIDGWWEDNGVNKVHLLDPWCVWDDNDSHAGAGWRDYNGAYLNVEGVHVCPTPAQVPSPRNDEATLHQDSDGDGVVDFDELYRFYTNRFSSDTDGDGVPDKQEIRSYIFDNSGNHDLLKRIGDIWVCQKEVTHKQCGYVYNPAATGVPWADLPAGWTCPRCGNAKSGFEQNIGPCLPYSPWDPNWDILNLVIANADCDGDDLRKERDADNDNDGALDGEEDVNHNGKYEPDLGETDPFDRNSFRFDSPYVLRSNQDLMAVSNVVVNKNLYVHGNLYCEGSKALVRTQSYGLRSVYVEESAESYHFDRGQSRLHNGSVTIYLEPIFLQTVEMSDKHPPLIRLMPTADCKGVYVSKWTATGFTVKEQAGGTSNAGFNWEVAAKRAGYAAERLQSFSAGE